MRPVELPELSGPQFWGARASFEPKDSGLAMDKLPASGREMEETSLIGSDDVATKLVLVIEDSPRTQ